MFFVKILNIICLTIIWIEIFKVSSSSSSQTMSCPQLTLLGESRPACECRSKNASDAAGSIEYSITCNTSNQSSSNSNSEPIIMHVEPIDPSLDLELLSIQSLSIINQHVATLAENAIDTSIRVFELRLVNDAIESISARALSNLVDLKTLRVNKNPLKSIDLSLIADMQNLETLDLSDNNLESISLELGYSPIGLKSISLSQNSIVRIAGKFSDHFPDLETLDLRDNYLGNISLATFSELANLIELDLSFNEIATIEAFAFTGLSRLEKLHLDQNALTFIDASYFSMLAQLRYINLDGNKINEIMSDSFVSLSLETLDLSKQGIKSMEPNAIRSCDKLTDLILAFNQLHRVPDNFLTDLPLLDKIDLTDNVIDEIVYDAFGELDQLRSLYLYNNYISSIQPGSFIHLTELRRLFLNNNLLRELRADMFVGLESLTDLMIDNNKLTRIDANLFRDLTTLQSLNLQNNLIFNIEPFAFINQNSMTDIGLANNQLVDISPDMFAGLSNLDSLTLAGNKITSVARNAFANMSHLTYLNLEWNQLSSLDAGALAGLNQLQTFLCTSNRLARIEAGAFDNLTELVNIGLASNRLRRIDNGTFAGVEQLQELDLSLNPLDEYVEKNVLDRFGSSLTSLRLDNIEANPSDFLNLSAFVQLYSFEVIHTRFQIDANTFDTISDTIVELFLESIGLRNLSLLPIEDMTALGLLSLNNNPLDWSTFCFGSNNKLFRFQPEINTVYLKNTSLKDLGCLGLTNANRLKHLDASYNQIETIEPGVFRFNCMQRNPTRECFQSLYLNNNRIKFIQPGSFDYIHGLGNLALSDNLFADDRQLLNINCQLLTWVRFFNMSNSNLSQLPLFDSIVPKGYKLTKFYVSHNRIQSLDAKYFEYLQELTELDLADNRIARVESTGVFLGSPKLEILNLSSNLLDSKSLSRINFNICVNLKFLNLSRNRIDVLESFMFNSLKKIEIIDVSFNQLRQIQANSFIGLSALKNLYLLGITTSTTNNSNNNNKNSSLLSSGLMSSNVSVQDNFITGCEMLKFVYLSSIDLVRDNTNSMSSSLKAMAANKVVNQAVYYNSINIIVDNFDYYKLDRKSACELTILFLKRRIHVNLFDDFDFDVFLANCYSLDLADTNI